MTITEVNILPVKPKDGFFAYASFVLDEQYYVGNIQVFTRLDKPGTIRLFYPQRKVGDSYMDVFHPLTKEASQTIEEAVQEKCLELQLIS